MAKAIEGKPGPLRIRSTEDGLHLDGSILWFDAQRNGDLSFLSSAETAPNGQGPQYIATEETIKILEANRRRPKALICQYNRPFSIGRLKMELLPSGCVLGGASLHVETDSGRILYAPHLQTQKIATVRQMQLKKAHTLILCAHHPDPNAQMPNRRKEKERLLSTIQSYVGKGIYPIVLCQPSTTAQELTKALTEAGLGVAVHHTIYRINKVYETYGAELGPYALHNEKHTKKKVLIYPMPEGPKNFLRKPLPDGPVLYIEDTLGESSDPEAFRDVDDRFYISSSCDGRELREIIAAVAPREVYMFGPYAKRYAEELKNCGPKVRALFPNHQPTLF